MKKHLIVKKKGNTTTHYLRPYWGKIPFGFKVISEVFDTMENGDIAYTRYSADGSRIIEEGHFRVNPETQKKYKVGKWIYYDSKFKYCNLPWKNEIYDETGKKIEQNIWTDNTQKSKIWKDDGTIIEAILMHFAFKQIIITDTKKGTQQTDIFDCQTKNLVRRIVEKSFDKKTETYRQTSICDYDINTGRLTSKEHRMMALKNIYISERYPEGKRPYFEYAQKEFGHRTILFSSFEKEDVYKFYVTHLKLAKKDNKKRRSVIEKLRSFPTLKAKKEFLRNFNLSQTQNYKGA